MTSILTAHEVNDIEAFCLSVYRLCMTTDDVANTSLCRSLYRSRL